MSTDRKFLHELEPVARYGDYRDYLIAGRTWSGNVESDRHRLSLHDKAYDLGYLMLEVGAIEEQGYVWTWCCMLAEGVYARLGGQAESVEAACAAALAYRPEIITYPVISPQRWLQITENYWITAIDGEEATVHMVDDGRYRWSRAWAPAADLIREYSYDSNLHGAAITRALAMVDAEHAPSTFRAAIARLLASTRAARLAAAGMGMHLVKTQPEAA